MENDHPLYFDSISTYEEAINLTYGSLDSIALDEVLIRNTLISKKYCNLFPNRATREVLKLRIQNQERTINLLGQLFASEIVTFSIHQRLYQQLPNDESDSLRDQILRRLENEITNVDIPSWMEHDTDLQTTFSKLLMPYTFEPLPSSLKRESLVQSKKFFAKYKHLSNIEARTSCVDQFVLSLSQIASNFYREKGDEIFSTFPTIPKGKAIPSSLSTLLVSINWYLDILKYINSSDEFHYRLEPYLIAEISDRVLTIGQYLTLDIPKYLEVQEEATRKCLKGHENSNTRKITTMIEYPYLIPWRFSSEKLQELWRVLIDSGMIEDRSFEFLYRDHFTITSKVTGINKRISPHKITWLGSSANLIRLIRSLESSAMISSHVFSRNCDTSRQGRQNRLIVEHFCDSNGRNYNLDQIRKAAHRISTEEAKFDRNFNTKVLKKILALLY